jgi:periodic tryptophan protein 1
MSMITTTAWVRRGVAAQFPTKYEIDEEEFNRISKLARQELEDAKGDLKAAQEEEEEREKNPDAMDDDAQDDKKEGKKGTTK